MSRQQQIISHPGLAIGALAILLGPAIAQPRGDYPPPPGPYPFGENATPATPRQTTGFTTPPEQPPGRPYDANTLFGSPAPALAPTAEPIRPAPSPFVDRSSETAEPGAVVAPMPGSASSIFRPADAAPR